MSFNVGLNVVEVDGRVAPSIQAAPTSVAAFIIRSQRGATGAVRRVTNWTEFTGYFGDYVASAYGAYAVRGFFDNGGSVAYITRIDGGTAASRTLNDASDAAALTVTAGYRGTVDPGTWGNDVAVQITANTDGTYNLIVQYDGSTVETWQNLTVGGTPAQDPEEVINSDISGSKYIMVDVPEDVTTNPAAAAVANLENGADATFADERALGTAAAGALSRFDVHQVQLVCCPESNHENWVSQAITYCNTRGDRTFVGHTPFATEAADIGDYSDDHQANKVYGALYFPWIRVVDPIGTQKWIPPTGHVMGVYARTERERGIWKAPAGNAALLNGVLDVRYHITDAVHTDLVKNASVNAVRFIPGQGIVIDSSRTLSTSPLWLYVNVRLLFNFVKSSLMSGLRWVVQEPNDETLWNKVKFNSATPFLMGLWRRGAFGSGAPDEVFTVKIDAENNPPDSVQQGILNIEVYFYPSRPAETIIIIVGQQEGGATASEA